VNRQTGEWLRDVPTTLVGQEVRQIMKKPTIHVVDDDQAVRESIEWLIESVGLSIRTYGSAHEFLDNYTEDSLGCLILDVRMPGISGLDLQHILIDRGIDLPIVFVTGHGDVPMAVRALKNGAVDFIEKPFNDQVLLDTIQSAVQKHRNRLKQRAELENLQARYENLTTREQEVMDRVVTGKPNRDVGEELGISVKTVEVHRAKVMEKMQARSIADLVKMAMMMHETGTGNNSSS
jgi:FixJ family two-component response regulator